MDKNKCPYCDKQLNTQITRKSPCPHCKMVIFVRSGKLVTEDESITIDWLVNLENYFGINIDYFEKERNKLSKKFGTRASAHDTVWKILNQLLIKHHGDYSEIANVHSFMAKLLSEEDKDPTSHLIEAAKARQEKVLDEDKLLETKLLFLGHEELAYVRRLSKQGKFKQAEELLYKSEPTPAVLDEIRKISSKKAKLAKDNGDWSSVIKYLEEYTKYAESWKDFCINLVNQAPPEHTERDRKLLKEAIERNNQKNNFFQCT